MEIDNAKFDIEFIERTHKIISNYNGETEFTLLLNCLLGLIVLPNEYNKKFNLRFLKQELDSIGTIVDSIDHSTFIFNPTRPKKIKKKIIYEKLPKTFEVFLNKVRNGIAHISNCTPINQGNKWVGLTIRDIRNGHIELEVTLKFEQIKVISEYISTEYRRERLCQSY